MRNPLCIRARSVGPTVTVVIIPPRSVRTRQPMEIMRRGSIVCPSSSLVVVPRTSRFRSRSFIHRCRPRTASPISSHTHASACSSHSYRSLSCGSRVSRYTARIAPSKRARSPTVSVGTPPCGSPRSSVCRSSRYSSFVPFGYSPRQLPRINAKAAVEPHAMTSRTRYGRYEVVPFQWPVERSSTITLPPRAICFNAKLWANIVLPEPLIPRQVMLPLSSAGS